jgi:hypothetical protein
VLETRKQDTGPVSATNSLCNNLCFSSAKWGPWTWWGWEINVTSRVTLTNIWWVQSAQEERVLGSNVHHRWGWQAVGGSGLSWSWGSLSSLLTWHSSFVSCAQNTGGFRVTSAQEAELGLFNCFYIIHSSGLNNLSPDATVFQKLLPKANSPLLNSFPESVFLSPTLNIDLPWRDLTYLERRIWLSRTVKLGNGAIPLLKQ